MIPVLTKTRGARRFLWFSFDESDLTQQRIILHLRLNDLKSITTKLL